MPSPRPTWQAHLEAAETERSRHATEDGRDPNQEGECPMRPLPPGGEGQLGAAAQMAAGAAAEAATRVLLQPAEQMGTPAQPEADFGSNIQLGQEAASGGEAAGSGGEDGWGEGLVFSRRGRSARPHYDQATASSRFRELGKMHMPPPSRGRPLTSGGADPAGQQLPDGQQQPPDTLEAFLEEAGGAQQAQQAPAGPPLAAGSAGDAVRGASSWGQANPAMRHLHCVLLGLLAQPHKPVVRVTRLTHSRWPALLQASSVWHARRRQGPWWQRPP